VGVVRQKRIRGNENVKKLKYFFLMFFVDSFVYKQQLQFCEKGCWYIFEVVKLINFYGSDDNEVSVV